MSYELTQKILEGLPGCLGVTVVHPANLDHLEVVGWAADGTSAPWTLMPAEMRVPRAVYCCVSRDAHDRAVFVFADEVRIIDAPAHLVVRKILDMMYEMGLDDAAERLELGEDGEEDDEEDED